MINEDKIFGLGVLAIGKCELEISLLFFFLESFITLPKFDTFHIALINQKLISMFGYAITYNSKSCYLLCTKQEKSIPKHLLNFIYNLTVAKLKLHMFMDYKCGVRDLYGDSIIAVEKFY